MSLYILKFESVEEAYHIDTKNRMNPEKLVTPVSWTLYVFFFWIILTTFLQSRYYYYLYFAVVEYEFKEIIAPGNNILNVDPGFELSNLIPESQLLTAYQQMKRKIESKISCFLNCLWDSVVWYGFISLGGLIEKVEKK